MRHVVILCVGFATALSAQRALAERVLVTALQTDTAAAADVSLAQAEVLAQAQLLATYEVVEATGVRGSCDAACAVQAAKVQHCDAVLVGSVAVKEGNASIALTLIDVATNVERHRASVSRRADEVGLAARAATTQLLAPHRYLGGLLIAFEQQGAAVVVDGTAVATTPMLAAVTMVPGRHEVEVRFPDVSGFRRFINVDYEKTAALSLALVNGAIVDSADPPPAVEPAAAVEAQPGDPASSPPMLLWGGASAAGLGVLSLAGGAGFAAAAGVQKNNWNTGEAAAGKRSNDFAIASGVLLGIGAGAVVVGGAMAAVALATSKPTSELQ